MSTRLRRGGRGKTYCTIRGCILDESYGKCIFANLVLCIRISNIMLLIEKKSMFFFFFFVMIKPRNSVHSWQWIKNELSIFCQFSSLHLSNKTIRLGEKKMTRDTVKIVSTMILSQRKQKTKKGEMSQEIVTEEFINFLWRILIVLICLSWIKANCIYIVNWRIEKEMIVGEGVWYPQPLEFYRLIFVSPSIPFLQVLHSNNGKGT